MKYKIKPKKISKKLNKFNLLYAIFAFVFIYALFIVLVKLSFVCDILAPAAISALTIELFKFKFT